MRLAQFILDEMETILREWEAFAATNLPAAASMNPLALRDHAQQILEAVAKDLSTPQGREAQLQKSWGHSPKLSDAPETAAQTHALLRARSGFDINQLVAEYRALRTSVLRLWSDACPAEVSHADDIVRFNEAIDQAIAESVEFFSAQVEQARDLLLGMLGHDMRSPLQTIQATAAYLVALNTDAAVSEAASRLIRSGARMQALLDDLVDFNRTRLGLGVNIAPTKIDLAEIFADELAQIRAAHADRRLALEVRGDAKGVWDGHRLQQLLSNLVLNAIKYGDSDEPVQVLITGDETEARFEVRNRGAAIEPAVLDQLFSPLKRGPEHGNGSTSDGSLGLGLYIAREIALAHGGQIEARSANTETVFVVRLPRRL